MKRILAYTFFVILVFVLLYNSVYFKKLDVVKSTLVSKQFDPVSYANSFWTDKLIPNASNAIEVVRLVSLLKANPEKTFTEYSHALGIGNVRYFLVKGEGAITVVNEDDVVVLIKSDSSQQQIRIATEYIFGNAVRDASRLIDINEFTNTMDFNNISSEINAIIRAKVLPAFKQETEKGKVVQFTGAIELNKEHLNLTSIEVVPIIVNLKNE